MPLLSEHPPFNVTSQGLPRNFSKPFSSPSLPSSPHSPLDEFNQTQPLSLVSSSPEYHHHPLRRKSSRAELVSSPHSATTGEASITFIPDALASPSPRYLAPSLLPQISSTPLSHTASTSPSLSSTISTLQSTPTHSPIPFWGAGRGDRGHVGVRPEGPISSKRKFPLFKRAKRLPKGCGGDNWCVYAAVLDVTSGVGVSTKGGGGRVAEAERAWDSAGWDSAPKKVVTAKRGRSVRFAGLEAADSSGSGEEKDISNGDSTYTLSKYKFPTPPGYATWTDTFGHLSEHTPPTSPATLHYRGASFDLVNPHASLILGKTDIETPAEIDGLLDDYFTQRADMQYDALTGDMTSSSQSLGSSQDGSRPGRVLYSDPDSARRRIMHLPNAAPPTMTPLFSPVQESPLAARGTMSESPLATVQRQPEDRVQDTLAEDYFDRDDSMAPFANEYCTQAFFRGRELEQDDPYQPKAQNRGSSAYPHSTVSNPFDLTVSNDECDDLDDAKIDNVVATGGNYDYRYSRFLDAPGDAESGELAGHDEGADAEATVSHRDEDTTLGNIVQAYDYTLDPQTPVRADIYEPLLSIPHDISTAEIGRATATDVRHFDRGSVGSVIVPSPLRSRDRPRRMGPSERAALLGSTPHVPAPTPPPRAHLAQEYTEVPSSDRTYGATGELLDITPATRVKERPITQWPTFGATIDFDHNARVLHPQLYQHTDSSIASANAYGIPAAWSNADFTAPQRASLVAQQSQQQDRGLSGNPFLRASSIYSQGIDGNDDQWEDVPDSRPNLMGQPVAQQELQRLSHVTQESYANVSDDGTEFGFPGPRPPPAQGTPSLITVIGPDGISPTKQYANKAHRVLMSGPEDRAWDWNVKRAKQLLKMKIMDTRILELSGMANTQDKDQMRRDMAELERLRKEQKGAFKKAMEDVYEEFAPKVPTHKRSFFKGILGFGNSDTRSVTSSARGLLDARLSRQYEQPPTPGSLVYSPTANTFRTFREQTPPIPAMPTVPANTWSPLDQQRAVFSPRTRGVATPDTINTARTADGEEYEMHELRRYPGRYNVNGLGSNMAAMSSQTGLLPMHLSKTSHQDSTTTTAPPGRRLTDQEMIDRAPHWRNYPPANEIARPRLTAGLGLDLQPARPGTMQRRLLDPAVERNADVLAEQRKMSLGYWIRTIWFPPTAIMFGMGYFDGIARAKSGGRVEGMCQEDKWNALKVAAPLGAICYAVLASMIIIIVWLTHGI